MSWRKNKKSFGYVLCITEKDKSSYVCDKVLYDLDFVIKVVEEHIKDLTKTLNETDNSGCYMNFGGVFKEKDNLGLIADYEIKEMRSDILYVKFSVFEIEL